MMKLIDAENVTIKQLKYIREMQEHSFIPLPNFEGKTKKEASEYIKKYAGMSHVSLFSIEKGYD